MRQNGAIGRAIARIGQPPPHWTLPTSRLRLRTHRRLLGLSGYTRLHYLGAPRGSAATRGDSRLTVRVLLAEARAARSASLHAYFVCTMAARELMARLGRHEERTIAARGRRYARPPTSGRVHNAALRPGPRGESGTDGRDAPKTLGMLDVGIPRHASLHLLRAPDRRASRGGRASQRREASQVSRTLVSPRIVASTQRILRELTNGYVSTVHGLTKAARRDAFFSPAASGTPGRSTIDARTVTPRMVAMLKCMPTGQMHLLATHGRFWDPVRAVAQRRTSAQPSALAAAMSPDAGRHTWLRSTPLIYVSVAEAPRGPLANAAPARSGSITDRPTTRRLLRLLGRRADAMHGEAATRRTSVARAVSTKATMRAKRITSRARSLGATMQRLGPLRPRAPGERVAARLAAVRPIDPANDAAAPAIAATMPLRAMPRATAQFRLVSSASARAAAVSFALPRSYAGTPAAILSYRRTPRAATPDTTHRSSQSSQLQQQVVRQVTQELTQNTPWRGQLEQAVLAPRVLRELTERVAGAIAGRQGLERYRRGL
jgi:hypothetical protein